MKKQIFGPLLVTGLLFLASVTSFAQSDLTKKQSLVLEFRRLTGADRVNMSINLSTEDVRDSLSDIVEKDPGLNEAQKQELRKDVAEAYSKVDKFAKDFFADKSQINQLSEQVIFRIYDNGFSETELTEAIAFYKSPTGQKTAAFLPTLSAQAQKGFIDVVVPKLQQLIQPVSVEETTKLKQKVAEIKTKKPSN